MSRYVWGGALLPLRVTACFRAHLKHHMDFPGGSDGKASVYIEFLYYFYCIKKLGKIFLEQVSDIVKILFQIISSGSMV